MENESTSPLGRLKQTIKKRVLTYNGLRETLTTFQPFIERLREFGGTLRDFIPYRISIPPEEILSEEIPPERNLHLRYSYNKHPAILLLAPKPQDEPPQDPNLGPDLVFVINTHGGTCVNVCTRSRYEEVKHELAVYKIIEGMNITLLERVPCGVTNIGFDNNIFLIRKMKEIVDEDRTEEDFPTILQTKLRKYEWDEVFKGDPDKRLEQWKTYPWFESYTKEEGWRIVGRMEQDGFRFLERHYAIEDDNASHLMSVSVLYAKPGSPFTIGTNILKSDRLTRSDLFQIAKGAGHKNIVVLDTSCGGFPAGSGLTQDQSRALSAHYKALGFAGGKRKRKRKTKRQSKKVNTRV